MKYFVGIDSGGTKTLVHLCDEELNLLKEFNLGPGNIHQIGEKGFSNLMEEIFDLLEQYMISIDFITFGIPGYNESVVDDLVIEKIISNFFHNINYEIYNDVKIASFAALNFQEGINIIAGTGSIALSTCNGKDTRTGGWGYAFGDEGSAYYIGQKILRAYAKQKDGRTKPTVLSELIDKKFGFKKQFDIIDYIYKNDNLRTIIASFCEIGAEAAKNGCITSSEIFQDAAYELFLHIETLANQSSSNKKILVSYSGGVFKSEELLIKPLQQMLNDSKNDYIFKKPMHEPVVGATLNSFKKYLQLIN